jgi:hypothetical protein
MKPPTKRFKNKPLTTSFVVTWSQSSLRNCEIDPHPLVVVLVDPTVSQRPNSNL